MSKRQEPDLFHQEARRLARLPARDRKEALAVHRRIADNPNLSAVTRDYASHVAETLENLIEKFVRTSDEPIDDRQQLRKILLWA